MKPFSHNYFLGYINEVTPQYIKIHFPSSILLNKFHFEGTSYTGGGVGNFVVIEGDEYGFLAQLTEVKLSDSEKKELTEKAIEHKDSDFHPIGKAELLLSFSVYEPQKIEKTVSKYPSIGAKVYSCSDDQIAKYVKQFGYKGNDDNIYASLGRLTSNNVECKVALNSLFGRHCAVVGTTGGGKSWTISKLIEEITKETDNKVILIDATGEYEELVKYKNQCVIGEKVYFSFKEMTNSDFCFLFREHSPNTSNALCEAINSLKLIYLNKFDGVKIGKNVTEINRIITENTSNLYGTNFDIQELPNQIKNECVKQGWKGIYEEDTFKLGYCSHLISRVNAFLQNSVIQKAFGININKEGSKDINDIIEKYEPEVLSIEDLFFNTNTKTAIKVAQARGVLILAAKKRGMEVYEYTPLQIKQGVAGYGKATKTQVKNMLKVILNVEKLPSLDDITDSIAMAVCHAHANKSKKLLEKYM